MATEVEICNLALSHIRAQSINSLNESSFQAQQCKLKYPIARDFVLEDFKWGFATTIKPLAVLSDKTVFNWKFVYQYPTDCLRIDRCIPNIEYYAQDTSSVAPRDRFEYDDYMPDIDAPVDYKVMYLDGSKVIVSNEEDLRAEYRFKVENTALFPSSFVMSLSHLLAAELAVPIIGGDAGRAYRSDEMTLYGNYAASAASADSNQESTTMPESEFVTVRI
jgi:hypothetical protein